MNVGIVCYASVGGSGVVATELAKALAGRGHQVRLISSEIPFRLGDYQPGVAFHIVQTPAYPLFREPQYLLSLTTKLVEVSREFGLDIIHAHLCRSARHGRLPGPADPGLGRRREGAKGDYHPARDGRDVDRQRQLVLGNRSLLYRAVGRGDDGLTEPEG